MLGKDQYVREMWEYCSCERSKVKKFRDDAEKEKQEGIQGQWQRESPAKEYLEQVKCCKDSDCTPRMMKQALFALKGESGEAYKSIFRIQTKATEWAIDRIQEAFEKLAKDEARKPSTVQEDMIIKYRLLVAHHRASRRAGRRHDVIGGSQRRKSTQTGGVQSEEKNLIEGRQAGWWCTARPMWELDQCTEVAGESTRGWRRPYTEYCDKPL